MSDAPGNTPRPEVTATRADLLAGVATATPAVSEPTFEPTPAEPLPATETPVPPRATPTATPDAGVAFDPEAVTLDVELVAAGFTEPLYVTHAGDGSGRVFVVERAGSIRLLTGELLLDISGRVGSDSTEQGLLGLAFHPSFAENRWLYVYYTDLNGDTVVARFDMTGDAVIDPGSEHVILTQQQPAGNHNGGMLAFGPDGYLYIGLGDGGRSYDAFGTAQDRNTLLGKLLRIDVDGGDPYGIPPDNPFVGEDGARPEVWAWGLRNPWRFSFDRATGDLYIADVGQNAFEWLHFQPADSGGGENYGWPIFEGDACLIEERCGEEGFTPPIAVYSQSEGGCAIIGGYVYRGAAFPALQGAYLNGDLCSGNIWATAPDDSGEWQTTLMAQIDARISSFGEDEDGELYVTDLSGGRVFRFVVSS
ncbi:MAG TPA: PQQ-dependent sugar dehydrogenase [Thermomicrobiales bacterium]|nr:PQQ-dependent sugar dehydrogenase [Thermomicrobiales bacterium]